MLINQGGHRCPKTTTPGRTGTVMRHIVTAGLLLRLGQCSLVQPLRILAAPAPLYSHWVPMISIAKELTARGHQVKVGTQLPAADKMSLLLTGRSVAGLSLPRRTLLRSSCSCLQVLYAADEDDHANKLDIPYESRLSFPNTSPSTKIVVQFCKPTGTDGLY